MPKSAADFLKPQYAGKIVAAYPADDDATLFVFYDIVKKYGWGYMDKYMAQKPNFIQGHLGELKSIADGTNAVTFDATNSTMRGRPLWREAHRLNTGTISSPAPSFQGESRAKSPREIMEWVLPPPIACLSSKTA